MSEKDIKSDGVDVKGETDEQMDFVLMLSHFPEIFDKRKTPSIAKKKENCWEELTKRFNANSNKHMTVKQAIKKFNNMKNKVKERTHLTETGNKKVCLNEWQETFFELWNSKGKYPVFSKLPGAAGAGTSTGVKRASERKLEETPKQKIVRRPEKSSIIDADEEYTNFSLPNLQRLVLLQQMNTAKAQEKAAIVQERAATAQEKYFKSIEYQGHTN